MQDMSQMTSHRVILVLILGVFLTMMSGCGDARSGTVFDSETGRHSSSWVENHGDSFLDDPNVCYECHGDDLLGGISEVSCFSKSQDGTACHGEFAFHGPGWDDPDNHGAEAKAKPARFRGFQACRNCHGADFSGGLIRLTCYTASCHDTDIPHSPAPWDGSGGGRTHTNTHWENGFVCAICHQGESLTPATTGTPINCFNNTLCHGNTHHSDDWVTAHAPTARSSNSSCASSNCHGTDYRGGAVGIGCYDCHLGGPDESDRIMHPNLWSDPEERHEDYLESRGKNASSCSPSWPGVAQYCHGDGLPRDSGLLSAPPEGSWSKGPTCYDCHGKKWNSP
jgi:hypothetical protein